MGRTKKYNSPTVENVNGKWKPTKCYNTWNSMMRRCTNEKWLGNHPTYLDCSICEEWLDYDIFYKWFITNYREGFQLDKDILHQGNKVYGPDTCVFVPSYINSLIIKCDASRGSLPIGVSFNKMDNKYVARLNINCKTKYIGLFIDPIDAHKAYCEAKYAHIKETALEALKIGDIDERVYKALLNYKITVY